MKSNKNLGRRRSRELALQFGYELDIRKICDKDEAHSLFDTFIIESEIQENDEISAYARELVSGIVEHAAALDAMLREHLVGWRPERMGITDRVAVQIALFEGVIAKNVDIPIAISEAVELARLFGTEDSARFVNGVLGRIVRAEK